MLTRTVSLELGTRQESVAVASVTAALDAAVSALQAVAAAEGAKVGSWHISKISMSSPIIVDILARDVEGAAATLLGQKLVAGVEAFSRSAPSPFAEADKFVSRLAEFGPVLHDGIDSIRFSSDSGHAVLTASDTDRAQPSVQAARAYSDPGQLDGFLRAVKFRRTWGFKLSDRVYGVNGVECIAPDWRVLRDMSSAVRRRCLLTGVISYVDHDPVSIVVETVEVVDDAKLPDLDSIAPIDLTGGIESSEYVRKLRNGEL